MYPPDYAPKNMTSAKDVCKHRNRGMHDHREGMHGRRHKTLASARIRYKCPGIDKTVQLMDDNTQTALNGTACFNIKKCGNSSKKCGKVRFFNTRTISALFYLHFALSV